MRRALIRRLPGLSPVRGVKMNNVGPWKPAASQFSTAIENSCDSHEVSDLIHEYASKPQTAISLQDMMMSNANVSNLDPNHNTTSQNRQKRAEHEAMLIKMADMLQAELPVRLAHRIQDLDSMHLLKDMPSVQQVRSIYQTSLVDLVHQPKPSTPQAEQDFGFLLNKLYQNHSNVLRQMARGVLELKYNQRQLTDHHSQFTSQDEAFLDRFYMSRVGIRVLAGQYLALRHQLLNDPMGQIPAEYVGMISTQTSPSRIVHRAIADATLLCQEEYPGRTPPKVHVSGKMQLTFCYIPTHLHYIVLELLKNSMRATMEHYQSSETVMPPIQVTIADGTHNEDVIIKISDQGGGIPRSEMDQIWSYLFTTASPNVQQEFFQATQQLNARENGAILAGLGYGLPLSRAYARYFGGELDLVSMEGYGTDAFCHLVRLDERAQISIPDDALVDNNTVSDPITKRIMKC